MKALKSHVAWNHIKRYCQWQFWWENE